MTRIVYWFFYALSLLPWRLLYAVADFEYFWLYRVFGYRRGIVRQNLLTAFPELSEEERLRIERKFYHWFCDYFFEAVKLLSIRPEKLKERLIITNSEEIENCFRQGQSVAAVLGHYCNWEWLSCVGLYLPQNRITGLVYAPLHSKSFEYLFRKIRSSQPQNLLVPKKDILRQLIALKNNRLMSIFGYISDQGPKWENIHLWLPFLNHDTPVFTGTERIIRKMNHAVYYVDMQRPKRGYYTVTYRLITRHPNDLPPNKITETFFGLLEQTIRRQPEYYLWTHNRWKRTKKEFNKRFTVVHGKVIEKR